MICKNCGRELSGTAKFCVNCGAPVEEAPEMNAQAPNYTQQNTYTGSAPQAGSAPKPAGGDDKKIVLQIFAGVFGLLLVWQFLKNFFPGIGDLFQVFSMPGWGVGFIYILFQVFARLFRIVYSLVALAMAAVLLATILRWTKERSRSILFTLAELSVLQLAIVLVRAIFILISMLAEGAFGWGYSFGSWLGYWAKQFGLVLLFDVILVGGLFGILYLMGVAISLTLGKEDLSAAPKDVIDMLKELGSSTKKTQSQSGPTYAQGGAAPMGGAAPVYGQAPTGSAAPMGGAAPVYGQTPTGGAAPAYGQAPMGGAAPVYNQAPVYAQGPLQTDRSLGMYILLTIVTCGIYGYYFIYKMAKDVNTACEGDGKSTSGLAAFILLSIVTCGIYAWVWYYNLGNRLQSNAPRYGLHFTENGTSVLMWLIFGSLLCGIGQFIAMNILIKNSNALCAAYNNLAAQSAPQA